MKKEKPDVRDFEKVPVDVMRSRIRKSLEFTRDQTGGALIEGEKQLLDELIEALQRPFNLN